MSMKGYKHGKVSLIFPLHNDPSLDKDGPVKHRKRTQKIVYLCILFFAFHLESIQAVNPFIDRIPETLKAEYMDEIVNQISKLKLIEQHDKTESITAVYDLLTVCAVKK